MTTKMRTKMTMKIKADDIVKVSFGMGMLSALETVDSAMDRALSENVGFDEFQTVIKAMIETLREELPEECRNYEDEQSSELASLFGEQEGTLQ